VLAAKPVYLSLRAVRPDVPVVVSTVTLTGHALALKELAGAALVLYFPFDWRFCVQRYLERIKPRAIILLETELWPNFLDECARQRIPVMLANGRISDGSLGWYRLIRPMTSRMLAGLTRIGVQTGEDKQRFMELGAPADRIRVTGNLKFDFEVPEIDKKREVLDLIRAALGLSGGDPVIVAGSTMKGEESLLMNAFSRVRAELPASRLIIAPRHPERFDEVAEILRGRGLSFRRRSRPPESEGFCPILLLDSIGELRAVYSLASVALIGGSFLPFGGHNPLEPAVQGKAVLFGPDMSNFKEIARLLIQDRAARQCTIEELPVVLLDLLHHPASCRLLGERAESTIRNNQGATRNTLALILPHVDQGI
jgi:3-deoxy-D-manno-octulosonic-acid transferase